MKESNGYKFVGFLPEMGYDIATDDIETLKGNKDLCDKDKVLAHIATLNFAVTFSRDIFTKKMFEGGIYEDGDYRFSVDLIRYYEQGKLGLPLEYEQYFIGNNLV